jgi:hypothetical protein
MLSAARDSKRSPDTGDLLVQIKLVAGAGFETSVDDMVSFLLSRRPTGLLAESR